MLSEPSDPASGHHTLAGQLRLLLTSPMCYKPLIIVNAIFIVQQIVGIYITIYFAVPLFQVSSEYTISGYPYTIGPIGMG